MDKENNLCTAGIDIGGTKIDAALVDTHGNIISSAYQLLDPSRDADKTITSAIDLIDKCLKESGRKPSAIGIGVAGQIDKVSGIVRRSPNLPTWQDVPLGPRLKEAFKLPVSVDNDVRVSTWGEWQHGVGQGLTDLVCVFVGTGVGGGVVSDGHLMQGCSNTAGELGHLTIVAGGRKCRCPNEGCLEAYAGGWAIAERAQDAVRANPSGGQTLLSIAGEVSQISAITVSQAYKKGDPLSQRLIKDTSRYLAAGVVSIVNAFNPCLIIFGGGVVAGLPDIVSMVEKRVREYALQTATENLRISIGSLGNKAGVIGAAALARDMLGRES